MEIRRSLVAPCPPHELFPYVDDLAAYRQWMPLVHDVVRDDAAVPPSWDVELRAKVGPFARSKRLRMVRTSHVPDAIVTFERGETDGRSHASWRLDVDLTAAPGGTELTMTLVYGGHLWTGAVLQRVLDDGVEEGSRLLVGLIAAHHASGGD
jgi:hypothetical protein